MDRFESAAVELIEIIAPELHLGPVLVYGDPDPPHARRIVEALAPRSVHFITRYATAHAELRDTGLASTLADQTPESAGDAELALILLSKDKSLAMLRAHDAALKLPQLREVYIFGHNKQGVSSLHKRFKGAFAERDKVLSARHCAAIRLAAPDHASLVAPEGWLEEWTLDPEVLALEPAAAQPLHIRTLPGVFSREHLDEGSRLLLGALPELTHGDALDLGAGAGVLGIVQALRAPKARVTLVEHDVFAHRVSLANIEQAGLAERVRALCGGIESVEGRKFRRIISNPPFHDGMETSVDVTLGWIERAPGLLHPDGDLVLVANRFLPYEPHLSAAFHKVERIDETPRFVVWRAYDPR